MSNSYGDKSIATLRSLVTAIDSSSRRSHRPNSYVRPKCGEIGMRAATRCMRCWSSLAPLPPSQAPGSS